MDAMDLGRDLRNSRRPPFRAACSWTEVAKGDTEDQIHLLDETERDAYLALDERA